MSSSEIVSIVGSDLIKEGKSISDVGEALDGKIVALYFSAHWCPPCRGFTPVLVNFYKALADAGKPFEIIFVSSDQDQKAFDHYFGTHPWTAIPYPNLSGLGRTLGKAYGVRGIHALIVLDSKGRTISKDGRRDVMAGKGDPAAQLEKWQQKSESLN